jgi:hypothetical protein
VDRAGDHQRRSIHREGRHLQVMPTLHTACCVCHRAFP